jgi:hypothetical protein
MIFQFLPCFTPHFLFIPERKYVISNQLTNYIGNKLGEVNLHRKRKKGIASVFREVQRSGGGIIVPIQILENTYPVKSLPSYPSDH